MTGLKPPQAQRLRRQRLLGSIEARAETGAIDIAQELLQPKEWPQLAPDEDSTGNDRQRGRRSTPAAVVDPARPAEKIFTFSFASGRHPWVRDTMEWLESVLMRTLYRPFMRFMPPQIERVTVAAPSLPPGLDGFTIAQLSDIHHSQSVPLAVIEQWVDAANRVAPDVIFLTGDFVTNDASYMAACARALARLQARYGVYAILGNHDYWTDPALVARTLEQNGIPVLINAAIRLVDGLWVAGIDDAWSGRPDLDRALAGVAQGASTILLAHEPDFADQAQGRGILLQLSGHSHGGQVHVPFTRRPVLPFLAWKYYAGLHQAGDVTVYTSRGMGTMQPPFIFTCRPEIAVLRLQRAVGTTADDAQ